MNAVKEDVIQLVDKELKSANEKFPLFHSAHEGYAVIKEELEESEEQVEWCKEKFGCLWEGVKDDFATYTKQEAKYLKEFAIDAVCELIQVAAMAQKFIDSMEGDKE